MSVDQIISEIRNNLIQLSELNNINYRISELTGLINLSQIVDISFQRI